MGTLSKIWIIFLCMGFIVCFANAAERSSQPEPAKELEEIRETTEEVQTEEAGPAEEMEDVGEVTEEVETETEVEELNLPEDTSPRLVARDLLISGNTLISTEKLLAGMPAIYNASRQPLAKAESRYLYDLRIIHEIISEPGQPREVSSRTIQGLTQYILSVYQAHHYAGIYVYVPEETIIDDKELVDGILLVKVLEAPVSEVTITFYDTERNEVEKGYLRRSAVEQWSPVKTGKVANRKKLDYLVNLLNLNPDRHVSTVVSRGAEPNTLAIEYDIYETNPWHYFIQTDNSGTDDRKWAPRIGLINTNLFGIDDKFIAVGQATPDSTIDENFSLYGSYDFPVMGPRLRLNLYGAYSEFDITPETGVFDFLGSGLLYGGILRYNVLQQKGWFFDITGSISHEESEVIPSLWPELFASDVEMNLWSVGIDVHRSDDMSNTSLIFNTAMSMGGSSQSDFTRARFGGAERDFTIYTTSANHSRYLDQNKVQQLRGTVRWIVPSERLVPAKMTSFGGMYSVRGYEEYEIVADGGILASIQYEFDLVRHSEAVEQRETEAYPWFKKLAPVVFIDYGLAQIKDAVAGEDSEQSLCSVGPGFIAELKNNLSGAVYYGFPLEETDETDSGEGRLNLSFMLRW